MRSEGLAEDSDRPEGHGQEICQRLVDHRVRDSADQTSVGAPRRGDQTALLEARHLAQNSRDRDPGFVGDLAQGTFVLGVEHDDGEDVTLAT